MMTGKKPIQVQDVLQLQWGWITPGTGEENRFKQSEKHLEFLAEKATPATRHFLFTHCGWWLDRKVSPAVRNLTGQNPEPYRALVSCGPKVVRALCEYVRKGRLEYVVYPYAACVAEATTGEGLLRSLRMSMEIASDLFGRTPRAILNHDSCYNLEWCAAQMPQIARLLGLRFILAMNDGYVRSPDGATLRILGRMFPRPFVRWALAGNKPLYYPLELAQSVAFHRDFPKRQRENPTLAGLKLRAVTLDEYLRRVRPEKTFDALKMGTKGWYGGTIDSLAMEQNVKSVELRLPAVEAFAVLVGRHRAAIAARLSDLWKKSFILMDNHTLWQCHNYKAHYLPQSFKLLDEAAGLEAELLNPPKSVRSTVMVFNPTPWPRDLVLEEGGKSLLVRDVPGWGARAARCSFAAQKRGNHDVLTFSNDRITYRMNDLGHVVGIRTKNSRQEFAGLGRLLRIHEKKRIEKRLLKPGEPFSGFEGALSASFEIDLSRNPCSRITFKMTGLEGEAFLLQSRRLDAEGNSLAVEWLPLHSLHWGGGGMPRHRINIAPRQLNAVGAARIRITLWMLSDGCVRLGCAKVWLNDDKYVRVSDYRVAVSYRNAYTEPTRLRARVIRSDSAMKSIRFSGCLPDLRFAMDVSLRAGSASLEYLLRLHFPDPAPLGLSSPPFTPEDGSLLGAQCERPYVPGLAVLFPLPAGTSYFSDKPFCLQPSLTAVENTWHTDMRDWWLGMSPFIGMNLAAADYGSGQLGLLTRGLKHFFRWRRNSSEALCLSLGASLIHQMTQGHSAPATSELYNVIKRTDHNPYRTTKFLYARGRYEFHFGICPAGSGEVGRRDLWRAAQEFALPGRAFPTARPAGACIEGITVSPSRVVVTALEPRGARLALRCVNMSGRNATACIRLPFQIAGARLSAEDVPLDMSKHGIRTRLAPWAVREILLQPL